MRKTVMIIFAIVLVSFIISFYYYPQIPNKMASHWNSKGQIDGYMPKFQGLFLMPFILVGLFLIFIAIPKIDPLKTNIEKFRKYYDGLFILFFIFMFLIHLQIILWNLGIKLNPNIIIPIGSGILFFYVGILSKNIKRNWFIGIRTPWTLSSERVWEKTHRIGGKLFKIAGIISFAGVFFQNYALFFILIPIILVSIYAVIYSYIEFRKEKNEIT
jgi:uncharacterized membrane protein